jgi:hypothetical protein
VKPEYPLVSLVDPDATCFLLKEGHGVYWMIEVDMRNKVLKSSAWYIGLLMGMYPPLPCLYP